MDEKLREFTPEEIIEQYRYTEDEIPYVKALLVGAKAFMENAGAWKPSNPLTYIVQSIIVGFWLEHREADYNNYVRVGDFPLAVNALIMQLTYRDEVSDNGKKV